LARPFKYFLLKFDDLIFSDALAIDTRNNFDVMNKKIIQLMYVMADQLIGINNVITVHIEFSV